MNILTINGIDLKYESDIRESEHWWLPVTNFYLGYDKCTKYEYIFFGKKTITYKPKKIFTISGDIQSSGKSHVWWKDQITKKLKHYIKTHKYKK